jgi:hypothetical protein
LLPRTSCRVIQHSASRTAKCRAIFGWRRARPSGRVTDPATNLAVGDDNVFHNDRYKWSLQFTVINLTNEVALYNFLSTFSGTHYTTPRTFTAQLGFHF